MVRGFCKQNQCLNAITKRSQRRLVDNAMFSFRYIFATRPTPAITNPFEHNLQTPIPHTFVRIRFTFLIELCFVFNTSITRSTHCVFFSVAQANVVCRCTMVVKRGIVRWLAVEGCIRGLIPLGAGKSTLVRRLQHRDDVIVVRGMPRR